MSPRPAPDVEALAAALLAGDRAALAQAITLCESDHPGHAPKAAALLERVYPRTGSARRVGITGVPGVGKSTFVEQLGMTLVERGHRVAVLAIDPSSQRSGGSILGDKTRMDLLAADPRAYIRPSPSGGTLGGVHRKTREAMLLCEAAGYDVVLVETVGIGQSEVAVAGMVDTFCLLMLPGAGDELQGIKRGVLELADVLVVHKADGERLPLARSAARDLSAALRIQAARDDGWRPPVFLASSQARPSVWTAPPEERAGVTDTAAVTPMPNAEVLDAAAVWAELERHRQHLQGAGRLEALRSGQQVRWLWNLLEAAALHRLRQSPAVQALTPTLEAEVRASRLPASVAAQRILAALEGPVR